MKGEADLARHAPLETVLMDGASLSRSENVKPNTMAGCYAVCSQIQIARVY